MSEPSLRRRQLLKGAAAGAAASQMMRTAYAALSRPSNNSCHLRAIVQLT